MFIATYLEQLKERLLVDPIVASFSISRERATDKDGYLRARLTLVDESMLEFSEYVQLDADNALQVVTYSYHWADAEQNLILRWDNTPHFPDLPGFPHHIHDGQRQVVEPGRPMSLFAVLDEVVQLTGRQ